MVEITEKEFYDKGNQLYGEDQLKWEFKCTGCGRIQTGESVKKDLENGIRPQRYPNIKRGDDINIEQECFSIDCNWVAYGLFTSGLSVIREGRERPTFIFPFAACDFKEKEDNKKTLLL